MLDVIRSGDDATLMVRPGTGYCTLGGAEAAARLDDMMGVEVVNAADGGVDWVVDDAGWCMSALMGFFALISPGEALVAEGAFSGSPHGLDMAWCGGKRYCFTAMARSGGCPLRVCH